MLQSSVRSAGGPQFFEGSFEDESVAHWGSAFDRPVLPVQGGDKDGEKMTKIDLGWWLARFKLGGGHVAGGRLGQGRAGNRAKTDTCAENNGYQDGIGMAQT